VDVGCRTFARFERFAWGAPHFILSSSLFRFYLEAIGESEESLRSARLAITVLIIWSGTAVLSAAPIKGYVFSNLFSTAVDPDLINPWGIALSTANPFWVSNNGTGKAALYSMAGMKQALVAAIPGTDPITGQVFDGTGSLNGNPFLFSSGDGSVDGSTNGIGNAGELSSASGSVSKWLTITGAKDGTTSDNLSQGTNEGLAKPKAPIASAPDPAIFGGLGPLTIQNFGGVLYVAVKPNGVPGLGNASEDTSNAATQTSTGVTSQGVLDSPGGGALAPAIFGSSVLAGNSADGTISAFFVGGVVTSSTSFANDGLPFGNVTSPGGTTGGDNGINGAASPLDAPAAIPEPKMIWLTAAALALVALLRRVRA
jgi:hypothetical protein